MSLGAQLDYQAWTPQASLTGDTFIQATEMLWLAGNYKLRNRERWHASTYLTWLPCNQYQISAELNYSCVNNDFVNVYSPAPADLNGLVRTPSNAKPIHSFEMPVTASGSFFQKNST